MTGTINSMDNIKGASESTPSNQAGIALCSLLAKIDSALDGFGNEFNVEKHRISDINDRFTKSRFHLAVLGQFKRGKSTFLNALLGEKLLPSAVIPLTSVPTYISWAPERRIKVIYRDSRTEEFATPDNEQASTILAKYVTEENNPRNRLGVESVEVGHPSSLLRDGVVLIDTPGIGSTFEHNTEATMQFIPQCDAALFLISSDPPITQVEIEFLKSVRSRIVKLFFIVNKIDYLNEREQESAVSFLRKVLQEQFGATGKEPIFCVSSRQGLDARATHNDELWRRSGMAEIEQHLVNFLVEEKSHTLHLALTRKTQDIVGNSLMRLQLQQKLLSLPLEDLEARLKTFQHKLQEAEQKRIMFKDLLAGDEKRTIELINEQSGDLYRAYYNQLCAAVEKILHGASDLGSIEKQARQHISEVIPGVFNQALDKTALQMDEHINRIIGSYQQQLLELVETIRKTAADIFEIGYVGSHGEEIFEMKHEPFWVTEGWRVNWSPLPENAFESILPRNIRIKRLKKRLLEDIDSIISHNVGNLRWATVCNITDSFYRFRMDIDGQIQKVIESTGGAIVAARDKRIKESDSIEPELNKVAAAVEYLTDIKSSLAGLEEAVSKPDSTDVRR
jgi:GTP-binding protein EngB required for normal cell division